jgi:hypothetical protein
MKISKPIRIVAMVAIAMVTAAPMAAGVTFKSQFMNESSSKVKVDILRTNGTLQKDINLKAGENHTFKYEEECGSTKTRKFDVWDKTGGKLGPKIGTGEFEMKTTKADILGSCKARHFNFDSCDDISNTDKFSVTCSSVNENKGVVEIKN